MALVEPFVFQVAGYQNSGKTTLINQLIESLSNRGIKTVTIKHHGHGGKPDVTEQKDSASHIRSGAIASLVEGSGRVVLQADNQELTLEGQIGLLKFFQPDVIIVEGYKKENYPKLVIVKGKDDLQLIKSLTQICTMVYWDKEVIRDHLYPSFSIKDKEGIINWTTEFIMKKIVHKKDEKS
ncbi:molybdopterin-guanine dinucleotide biosynthesis protein B [Bacillus sp. USDA818B3_A]|uniref:molybdopterin-guanine dinucleotide biosynthesis protein B n=1 Tax=Bacillus sp. USDA818B3_A TaxID=2698834 RepID=UPI00136C2E2B|nr:molybdopterin-guanine dinucleotide biosynthesis protein B [Bacillus sp. USDA818B3_A]